MIRADERRLGQSLDHLITARDPHHPHDGTVNFDARRTMGEVQVRVRDTGKDIPFHVQAHIFDRFVGRDRGGPGLGPGPGQGAGRAARRLGGRWRASPPRRHLHLPPAGGRLFGRSPPRTQFRLKPVICGFSVLPRQSAANDKGRTTTRSHPRRRRGDRRPGQSAPSRRPEPHGTAGERRPTADHPLCRTSTTRALAQLVRRRREPGRPGLQRPGPERPGRGSLAEGARTPSCVAAASTFPATCRTWPPCGRPQAISSFANTGGGRRRRRWFGGGGRPGGGLWGRQWPGSWARRSRSGTAASAVATSAASAPTGARSASSLTRPRSLSRRRRLPCRAWASPGRLRRRPRRPRDGAAENRPQWAPSSFDKLTTRPHLPCMAGFRFRLVLAFRHADDQAVERVRRPRDLAGQAGVRLHALGEVEHALSSIAEGRPPRRARPRRHGRGRWRRRRRRRSPRRCRGRCS